MSKTIFVEYRDFLKTADVDTGNTDFSSKNKYNIHSLCIYTMPSSGLWTYNTGLCVDNQNQFDESLSGKKKSEDFLETSCRATFNCLQKLYNTT